MNRGTKKAVTEVTAFAIAKIRLVAATLATFTASTAISATTAAISAATASAAVAATTVTTAAATTAGWPRFTRARLIYGQRPSFDGLAINLGDRVLSVLFRTHRHESESARLPGELILHKSDLLHRTGLGEKLLQFVFGRIERKIAYV
jgi:hypothetical protein